MTTTAFTLANLSDLAGGAAQTAAITPFTQTLLSNTILVTVAGAASIILAPSLWTIGNTCTIADIANFATRASSPITITVIGGLLIEGRSSLLITEVGGTFELCYVNASWTAFKIVGHGP